MAYDVLLVAAIKDSDKATVIARRLRALKFRVRFDASRSELRGMQPWVQKFEKDTTVCTVSNRLNRLESDPRLMAKRRTRKLPYRPLAAQ